MRYRTCSGWISWRLAVCWVCGAVWGASVFPVARAQEIVGLQVVPHSFSTALRWRQAPNPELSARVELYLQNTGDQSLRLPGGDGWRFDGLSPKQLLDSSQWAWHDTPAVWNLERLELDPGEMLVCKINGQSAHWGVGTEHSLEWAETSRANFVIDSPTTWISAVTFLSTDPEGKLTQSPFPDQLVIQVTQAAPSGIQLQSVRLWAAAPQRQQGRIYRPVQQFEHPTYYPSTGRLPAAGQALIVVDGVDVPLAPVIVQVSYRADGQTADQSLWASLKVKAEQFDISGGWVASQVGGRNSLTLGEYLKTLHRMHIDTGQIEEVPGYTDNPELYRRYPIKRFNRLADLQRMIEMRCCRPFMPSSSSASRSLAVGDRCHRRRCGNCWSPTAPAATDLGYAQRGGQLAVLCRPVRLPAL